MCQGLPDVFGTVRVARRVRASDAERDNFGAVRLTPPSEQAGRQRHFLLLRTHHDILRLPEPPHHGWQCGGMPESVDIVGRDWERAEPLFEVLLAEPYLLLHREPARQVAVGLYPPAADDLPATGLNKCADALKEGWVDFLDLTVDPGLAPREGQFRVCVQPVAGAAAGGDRFVQPRRPGPKPNGVKVGVEDKMYVNHGGLDWVRVHPRSG